MIERTSVKDMYFLSPMQEGMLFHYLMDKKSPAYFEQTSYRISGQLDYRLFEQSFNRIIERYDVLRTIFVHEKVQRPLQVVLKQRKKSVYYEDISHLNEDEQEQWIKEFKITDKARGFELDKDTLIRLAILKISHEKYEIIWSFHHIIMDGWCISILVNDLLLTYYWLKQGEPVNLPPTAPYKNYIKWLEKQDKQAGIHYWERYLEHYENQAVVPWNTREKTKEKNREYEPKAHQFRLNRTLVKELTTISNENNVTMSTIMQTLWGILLQKYNNTDDVVFGAIVSGRPANLENVETIVGLFINANPIRVKAEPGETFLSLVKKMQSQMIQSRSYEFVPLAEIQSHSLLERELINHMFIFENYPVERKIKQSSGESISLFSVESVDVFEQTTYDLNFIVTHVEELIIDIKYNAVVYDNHIIQRIEAHLGRVLEQITAGEIPLEKIEIITPAEKNQILFEFNNKKGPYPRAKAYELFENHEAIAPGRTAVVYGDSLLSYGQLNRDVNRMARFFRHYGIGEEHIVAILLDRSPRLFEIIMALWKVGAAYIAMETDYPPQRVKEILNNSGTCFLVTRSEHVHPEIERSFQGRIIKPGEEKKAIEKQGDSNPGLKTDINNLAYILYTSGSTGKPKGAMVEHIGSMNHMQGKINDTEMDANSIVAQNGPQTFSVSIWQFFAPLTLGGITGIYTHSVLLEPERFINRLIRHQTTILELVPSYLNVLLDSLEKMAPASLPLKYLLPTGEELNPLLVKKWFTLFPGIKMINAYGSTETSDDVAHYIMDKAPDLETIPIGKPLQNLNMYIVDKHMKLCPIGIKGEVCVSGIGVGRGYLKDEARTKPVFMEDPFLEEKDVRLYKMGDLGCWLPDGNLLFFGRKDYQVKIRGHLIECGEIENRLLEIPHIKDTVVVDREDTKGSKYLIAYLVSDSKLSIPDIKAQLSAHLPGYMIPAYFMEIDRIPLTANGKTLRKALPIPRVSINESIEYHAPRDEVEKILAEIWEELLAVPRPGITDNFFDSGGHSLNGMALIANIHKRLNVEIPISELFNRPTIKELSEYIRNTGETIYSSIQTVEKRDYYILSSAQSRLVVLDNIAEKSTAYNLYTVLELTGGLDTGRLEKAFKDLIKRHESLRTAFPIIKGNPVQVICEQVDFQIEYYNENRIVEGEGNIKSIIHDSFIRPFDLSRAPLIRAGLIKIGEMKYLVMLDIHHIVCDGAAFDTIVKDISKLYAGESLPELRIQYKDYALRQLETMKSEEFGDKEKYWFEKLTGEIPVLNLFTDYPRPPVQSFAGSNFTFRIEKELSEKIKTLSGEKGATLYMMLMAAYYVLLFGYTGQEDIIVGTPTAGRQHADLKDILGMFVNMLTMRNYPSGEKTFNQFLREVKENALNAYQNQDYQFEELVAKLDLSRDLSRNPLFDTVFAVQNMDIREIRLPDLQISKYNLGERTAKFDITLYAFEAGDEILLQFNYCTRLFRIETIQRLCRHFINVLEEIVRIPEAKLYEIQAISKSELEHLLYEFNNTGIAYPRDKTIHGLFRRQVEETPDNIAVIGQSHPTAAAVQITYRELDEQSNRLAQVLKEKGIGTGTNPIVGMNMERSLEMIIGIMGILKAGGAYLPIDPDYPEERINYMLSDSSAKTVLTSDAINRVPTTPHLHLSPAPATSLAYIIYTSGTTGRPKGVVIEHINVVRLFFNDGLLFDFNRNDVWTKFHSYCFDFSVWEMYGALLFGGKLVMIPKIVAQDPRAFLSRLKENSVTILNQTPSAFYNLINEELTHQNQDLNLRYVIFGGEVLKPSMLKEWREKYPGTRLINMYGITEITVHATFKEIGGSEIRSGISNIGKPIPTTTIFLMNRYLKPVPPGVPGELYVGGQGIARGYLNRPELTKEKFNHDLWDLQDYHDKEAPFGQFINAFGETKPKGPDQKNFYMGYRSYRSYKSYIYRSGDLARMTAEDEMEYLGRIDHQVQLRGYRIEPGEIESKLLQKQGIKEALVIPGQDQQGNMFLCAYITAEQEPDISKLRDEIGKELPDYMIPNYFVPLEAFPLTVNGKVDRKQLPEPGVKAINKITPPVSRIEKQLVEIWQQVLKVEQMGIKDNYFHMGGDSIKALRLISSINDRFETDINIGDIYVHQTIEELAVRLGKEKGDKGKDGAIRETIRQIEEFKARVMENETIRAQGENIEDIYPMSDIEKGMVFYYMKNFTDAIYHDQPVYHWKYKDFSIQRMRKALGLLIKKHSILRSGFFLDEFAHIIYKFNGELTREVVNQDISSMARAEQEEHLKKYLQESRKRPFNILKPPLWRLGFFKIDSEYFVILWEFHHAILDGWSNANLLTELNQTYHRLETEPGFDPGNLKIDFKDYIISQELEKKNSANRKYWRDELWDYKRLYIPGGTTIEKKELKNYSVDWGTPFREEIEQAAKKFNTTLKNLCFAAYVYVLNMFFYENDITTGLVTHNRPMEEDGDKIIGCFLNTVPIRIKIPAKITWAEYIALIDRKMIKLKDHDRLSLLEIINITGEKTTDKNPIFDSTFNLIDFHAYDELKAESQEKKIENIIHVTGHERANFLFEYSFDTFNRQFQSLITYSTEFISAEMAERSCRYFREILNKFINESEKMVLQMDILPREEKKRLLHDFNATTAEFPREKTLHRLFEEQVGRTPDYTALQGPGPEAGDALYLTLTYGELNKRADKLAYLLREKGVGPDAIIGIMVERSPEMVIGILGILKAGSAYMPIDPDSPKERINYMLSDSSAKIVLTPNAINRVPTTPHLHLSPTPATSLAYIIYTSGSTGKPKGVLVEHRSVVNLVYGMKKVVYQYECPVCVALVSPFYFDASIKQIFPTLLLGHRLIIVTEQERMNGEKLLLLYEKYNITVSDGTPAHLALLLETMPSLSLQGKLPVREFVIGGEVLKPSLFEQLKSLCKDDDQKELEVVNVYGPTECCDVTTTFTVTRDNIKQYQSIPIGTPLTNARVYIIGKEGKLQPIGIAGELSISGAGLARGYLNRPELTAEKFIITPVTLYRSYMSYRTNIIYKTGDLSRWLPDGNIEFLGRIDQQVKIRGYRIEPGEIESQLLKCHDIYEAIVIDRENSEGKNYLCAYFVSGKKIEISELRGILSKTLPGYMIPSYFIPVEKIPLTGSGKIHREKLEAMGLDMRSSVEYTGPRNEIEQKLAGVWQKVLKLEKVGIHENFFDAGGTSLDIIKLDALLKEEFNETETVVQMFRYPTIGSFARYLSQKKQGLNGSGQKADRTLDVDHIRNQRAQQKQRRKRR